VSGAVPSISELHTMDMLRSKKGNISEEEREALLEANMQDNDDSFDFIDSIHDEWSHENEDVEDFETRRRRYVIKSKDLHKIVIGPETTVTDKIFIPDINDMGNTSFIGSEKGIKPPIRIFKISKAEALRSDIYTNSISIPGYSDTKISALTSLGFQVGFSIVYNGNADARILSFSGVKHTTEGAPYHEYIVISDGVIFKESAQALLLENADLFLRGNVIEPINNFNVAQKDILYGDIGKTFENVGSVRVDINAEYNINQSLIDLVGGIKVIKENKHVLSELVAATMADTILKGDNIYFAEEELIGKLTSSPDLHKYNELSNSIFIPSLQYTPDMDTEDKIDSELGMNFLIADAINNLGTNDNVSFYVTREIQEELEKDTRETDIKTGADLLSDVLGNVGFVEGIITVKGLSIKTVLVDELRKIYKVTVIRKKAYSQRFVTVNNKTVGISFEKDIDGKIQKLNKTEKLASIAAIYRGDLERPNTVAELKDEIIVGEDTISTVMLFNGEKGPVLYSIDYLDNYFGSVKEIMEDKDQKTRGIIKLSSEDFNILVDDIQNNSDAVEVINNLNC